MYYTQIEKLSWGIIRWAKKHQGEKDHYVGREEYKKWLMSCGFFSFHCQPLDLITLYVSHRIDELWKIKSWMPKNSATWFSKYTEITMIAVEWNIFSKYKFHQI